VTMHRAGAALERVQLLLADWTLTHQRITETETRMTAAAGNTLQHTDLVLPRELDPVQIRSRSQRSVLLLRRGRVMTPKSLGAPW
jgi:hypothetical protein